MKRFRRKNSFIILGILTLLIAVACTPQGTAGDDQQASNEDQPAVAEEPAEEAAAEVAAPEEPAEAESEEEVQGEPESDETDSEPAAEPAALGELSLSWTTEEIGKGIKPAFSLDSAGAAHVAFLTEADHGAVFYSTNSGGSFEEQTVAEGYFYGPVDIAVGDDDVPIIAYHDHQATGFDPNLGDEVVAVSGAEGWELTTVADTGHDGWDNAITVGPDGFWHTAAVDPAQFGSEAGIEYATNAGGDFSVEMIGSGPIVYEFGTSIQLDNEGRPGIVYYDNNQQALAYAQKDGDSWTIEIVDADGDAGRYAALAYDNAGNPHIAYYVAEGETNGTVRYAWWDGSKWLTEDVDTLADVVMGQVGARKITSLVIDENDTPHIAYTDRNRMVYGQRDDDGWSIQDVPHHTDQFLGQLVELELDAEGNPHLIWYEVESFAPLFGPIIYASGA
jgi:hypothetical protein